MTGTQAFCASECAYTVPQLICTCQQWSSQSVVEMFEGLRISLSTYNNCTCIVSSYFSPMPADLAR